MKLPEGYDLYSVIDLKANKKDNLFVTIGSAVIMAVMFIAAYFTKGVFILAAIGWVKIIINIVIAFFGSVAYIFLHEAVHAAFFKIFDTKCKLRFGFTAGMAYCASDGYYKKAPYLAVALSPVVIWTLLLLIPCLLVPLTYFWGVFFIQIFNVSGAAGDLYVTVKILTAPKKVLILDNGTDMEIYATDLTKKEKAEAVATAPKKVLILDNGTDMEIYATDLTKKEKAEAVALGAVNENADAPQNTDNQSERKEDMQPSDGYASEAFVNCDGKAENGKISDGADSEIANGDAEMSSDNEGEK